MKERTKEYFTRLNRDSKLYQKIFWWSLRLLMIGGIFYTAFIQKEFPEGITRMRQVLQMSANLVGLFAWEIAQMTSEKCFMRYLPAYIQNYAVVSFTLASFGGAFLNFYYSIRFYDLLLHLTGVAAGTWIGYEAITAMQLRDRKKGTTTSIAIWAAAGLCFMVCTGWELFEFTFDQIGGGDSQHWSMELAKQAAERYGTNPIPNIIPHLNDARFALMDTMEDTICNTLGTVIVMIFLKFFPYNHKGKHNVDDRIDALLAQDAAKAGVKQPKESVTV